MKRRRPEYPTIFLIFGCTAAWLAGVHSFSHVPVWLLLPVLIFATALHSSLQHEASHGHPTRIAWINEALVFPALGLLYPYRRFRTLHLRHHNDATLTDPHDDPESFYRALGDWKRLPRPLQRLLAINNTLAGRLILGPAITAVGFLGSELRLLRCDEPGVRKAWALHVVGVGIVYANLAIAGFPIALYVVGVAWPALSLIFLRTFAEHQASEVAGERTAIIESGPLFSLLFLNNNLHFVHHDNPRAPWYALPRLYREKRDAYRSANGNYCFDGYRALFRRFLVRAKSPVPHPYLRR